jgi:hypothetical protein
MMMRLPGLGSAPAADRSASGTAMQSGERGTGDRALSLASVEGG